MKFKKVPFTLIDGIQNYHAQTPHGSYLVAHDIKERRWSASHRAKHYAGASAFSGKVEWLGMAFTSQHDAEEACRLRDQKYG